MQQFPYLHLGTLYNSFLISVKFSFLTQLRRRLAKEDSEKTLTTQVEVSVLEQIAATKSTARLSYAMSSPRLIAHRRVD